MKIDKGLLVTSFFLDYLYTEVYKQDYEYLEMMVSDANFFIWAPNSEGFRSPADIGEIDEWTDAYELSGIETKEEFNSIEVFKIMLSYLKLHEKEYNFELKEVITLLEDMLLNPDNHKDLWTKWEESFESAEEYKVIPFEKVPNIKYTFDRYTNILKIIDETPLHISALKGDIELTESLLKEGLDINARDKKLWTPLYWSIALGKRDMVKHLIEKGADINIEDEHKKTPLYIACEYEEIDVAEYLIEKGADINTKNDKGETPLHAAYSRNNKKLVDMLLKKGANPI